MAKEIEENVSCIDVSMDLSLEVEVFSPLQGVLQDHGYLILCQLWGEMCSHHSPS